MNDVAAVADPNTGVAEYDSYGSYGPWLVDGGTSASTPLVAGIYGLAENASSEDAAKSLYPKKVKRDKKIDADLYDITSGNNGTRTPSYLCTAGPEYDGPSGNGTPHGIRAF